MADLFTIKSKATQLHKMADSHSRLVSVLNFLTGEGISYHSNGFGHSTLEALITDYFDGSNSGNGGGSNSSDKNSYSSNGKAIE